MVIGAQKKPADQLSHTNGGMTEPLQPGQTSSDNHAKQCSVENIAMNSDNHPLIDPANHGFFSSRVSLILYAYIGKLHVFLAYTTVLYVLMVYTC